VLFLAPLSLQLLPSPSNNTTSNTNIITENHTIHKVRISPSSSTAYTSESTQLAQVRGSRGCEPSPVAPSLAPRTRAQSTTCTINHIRSSSSLTRYRATSSLTSPAAEPALVHKVCNDGCVNPLLQFDTHITLKSPPSLPIPHCIYLSLTCAFTSCSVSCRCDCPPRDWRRPRILKPPSLPSTTIPSSLHNHTTTPRHPPPPSTTTNHHYHSTHTHPPSSISTALPPTTTTTQSNQYASASTHSESENHLTDPLHSTSSLPIPLPTHPASPWAALRTASLPSSSTSVSPTRAPLPAELLPPASHCPRLRQPTSPSAVCSTRRVLMAPTTAAPASSPRHLALAPAHLHPVWHLPSPLLRARLLPRPHCAPPHRRHLLLLVVSHVPCLPSTRTLTYPLKAGMS
jgi:hypothetical protein